MFLLEFESHFSSPVPSHSREAMTASASFQPVVGHTTATGAGAGAGAASPSQSNAPVSMAQLDAEKGNAVATAADDGELKTFPDETPDYDAQRGVQKIEATTLAWGKWSLVALLVKYVDFFVPRPSIKNFVTSRDS